MAILVTRLPAATSDSDALRRTVSGVPATTVTDGK